VKTLQERARTLVEMAEGALFYYRAPESYDETALAKFEKGHLLDVYGAVALKLKASEACAASEFDSLFKELCAEKGWKMPQVGQPVRIALSGGAQAPGIGEIIAALGIQKTIRRIERALDYISTSR
jgi:glutamyl-tRNA synthetase